MTESAVEPDAEPREPSQSEATATPLLLQTWKVEQRPLEVIFGAGTLDQLGEAARRCTARRAMVVTDSGIVAAGHVERGLESLTRAGLKFHVFDDVHENPTEADVARGAEAAKEFRPDVVIGLGGGSSMDCAKGINFIYTNGGKMEDYWGFNKAGRALLPSIGVPSTAGTGSEAQSFALISRESDHRKMACGDEKARFRSVILDPQLARTAPREVAAVTGLDAISHAIESAVTSARNAFSDTAADGAWRRLAATYRTILSADPSDEQWGQMLLGSHLAGAAIELSMLGAAHALANPLTARYDTPHGLAVGLMLPWVIRFNGAVAGDRYAELLASSTRLDQRAEIGDPAETLARKVTSLRDGAGLPGTLREIGVEESDLPVLAEQALEQWTGGFNPRPVSRGAYLELYRQAF